MPVYNKLKKHDTPGEEELKTELKEELVSPKLEGEPVIVIEEQNPSTTHLFVIWSKWKNLEQMVRSRIILDAYDEIKGEKESVKVTVAMGLTPEEADHLGIG